MSFLFVIYLHPTESQVFVMTDNEKCWRWCMRPFCAPSLGAMPMKSSSKENK